MRIEITVPNLPESVQDATLLDWRKNPGDAVTRGETLVELETDKVVLDVPAERDGVLTEVLLNKGTVVTGGQLLAILDTEAKAVTAETPPVAVAAAPTATAETVAPPPSATLVKPVPMQPVSPAVRRLLNEHGIDPAQIHGGGKGGRLTKQDVLDYLASRGAVPPTQVTDDEGVPALREIAPTFRAPAAPQPPTPAATPSYVTNPGGRAERRVPMTRLRARIAERMMQSQATTATLTTFNEVNLQKVNELRNHYKARFEQEYKIKLGFMSFFVKASVEALKRYPIVNASIEGDEIVYHDYYDIGIAVSTDRGLVVPILRDADRLDFGSIEKAVAEFAQKAHQSRLTIDELTGGTFSITNGGIFGSLLSTPILNPPQSAILGMHAIKDRPVVENGEIVIRPMIYLALSYDHRLIDGRDAVQFLYTIKELLEDPVRMVLSV